MKLKLFSILTLGAATLLSLGSSTASAVAITITPGVDNTGTDNVLFNDPTLLHSGPLVQGNFSGSGTGFIVDFTSASGNNQIEGGGGQAVIEGLAGNDPFTSLTFKLEANATFTKAVLNPFATVDGTINFSVSYLDALGSPSLQNFDLDGNGENFFTIVAGDGARITEVTFSSTNSAFTEAKQFRLGGFAPVTRVPEGGMTLLLLGASLAGIESLRRRFAKR